MRDGDIDRVTQKRIIVVLGMHRSGTSAVTRGLKALGVGLGDKLMPPVAGNNDKGFWEDTEVVALNDEMLRSLGYDWQSQIPLDRLDAMQHALAGFELRAVQLLRSRLESSTVFGLKDPRIARLLPFWKTVFEHTGVEASYVLAIRHPLSVAASLSKRDGFEVAKSGYLWLSHVVPGIAESAGSRRVMVDFDLLMERPKQQLSRIAEALGLPFDETSPEVAEYIDGFLAEGLRHSRFHLEDLKLAVDLPQAVQDAYALLDKLAKDELSLSSAQAAKGFARISQHLHEAGPALRYMTRQDEAIAGLRQNVTHQDQQLGAFNQTLAQRAAQIAELQQDAAAQGEEIASLNQIMAQRDQQIAALNQAVAERDHQIAALDQTIAQRAAQIAVLSQDMLERDGQISDLHQSAALHVDAVAGFNEAIAQRDQQIAALNQAVAERDHQIAALDQTIAQRAAQIAVLSQDMSERDGQISGLHQSAALHVEEVAGFNEAIAQREQEIASLRQAHTQRDEELAGLNKAILERAGQIANLEHAISSRGEEARGLKHTIAQRDAAMADLRQIVAEGEQQIRALAHDSQQLLTDRDQEIHHLRLALARTLRSRSWRITAPLRKLAAPRKLRFKSAIRQIHASTLFDAEYYLAAYPDVRDAQIDPATHYLMYGWQEHRNPSAAFDTVNYLAANPDVAAANLNPLVHYLKHGQKEGRTLESEAVSAAMALVGVTATDESVRIILASSYFDTDYYSQAAGLSFDSRITAVQHYVSVGEIENFRPSSKFDPYVYRTSYPDLAGLGAPLLVHYISHGAAEGRSAVFEVEHFDGEQVFDAERKTILVAVHELSQTGAPILGLNLVKHLSQDYNVICIAGRDGALQASFRKHVHKLVAPRSGYIVQCAAEVIARSLVGPLKQRCSIQAALVNSAEAAVFAKACYLENLPVVSLVHEFAETVFPQWKLRNAIEYSQRVVFSSPLVEKSARSAGLFGSEFTNAVVIPQGKSDVPSDVGSGGVRLKEVLRDVSSSNRFLVIGCGHIDIRKGIDLFIATASHVTETLASGKACFLWVGNGYAPEVPGDYSIWLRDQVRRADLQDVVKFIPALGGADLESLYRQADVLLLSSRLDPFPNVAIDAISAGLPVVCFDKATGIAEYLRDIDESVSLVVPYLNVRAAADAIIRLEAAPQAKSAVSARLKELAESRFNFASYVRKIESLLGEAVESNEQEMRDVKSIADSEFFQGDSVSWLGVMDSASRSEMIQRYVRLAAANSVYGVPRPFAGLSPGMYAEALNLPSSTNAFAQWLRDGRPAGQWLRNVLELQGPSRKSALKVALHIHLHYQDMVDDVLSRLQVNETRPDLFVTVTSDEAVPQLKPRLSAYRGKVEIVKVPNRGRDIASMLTVLSGELQNYDLIGHLHAKKSLHVKTEADTRDPVTVWREFLYENLLGSQNPALDLVAAHFEANPDLGLVFPEDPYACGWGMNLKFAQALTGRLKLGIDLPKAIEFPVGNMFFARPDAIKPLLTANFDFDDFPEEPVSIDGTILHAIERMTPIICENEGYVWRTTSVLGITR